MNPDGIAPTMISMLLIFLPLAEGSCLTKLDVAFVFDASTSIGNNYYQTSKTFARQIVSKLDIGPEKTRVCLIHLSKFAYVDFEFSKFHTVEDVQQAISNSSYSEGISAIDQGLKYGTMELLSAEAGARHNVPKFLIVFTDGDYNLADIQSFLSLIDSELINVLVVRIGAVNYKKELKNLVKDPSQD